MLTTPQRPPEVVVPILQPPSLRRLSAMETVARLAGERPTHWDKPAYGSFDYWLAVNCGWLSEDEITADKAARDERSARALQTSHRFKWKEEPRYDDPEDSGEYAPEISMKLIKDRNLTDSARRIAIFIMRHAYQDNRAGRVLPVTNSFIRQGLHLSRSTVQKSLTLLETRGYLFCQVAKSKKTHMCIGLFIHLKQSLFAGHHKKKWPDKAPKPGASRLRPKQRIQTLIEQAEHKISRQSWAIISMEGVFKSFMKTLSPPIAA